MRLGTPGFEGGRLREAREARGINVVTLADLLGVSRQAIYQYEAGGHTPHPEALNRIASVLNLPTTYFYRPYVERTARVLHFRALSSASKAARLRSASRLDWLRDIVDWLSGYVELPEVNLPVYDVPADPAMLSWDQIEQLAIDTRRFWGLQDGPISNVVRLLEKNGVILCRGAVDPDIDAFATWDDGRAFVFLGNEKQSASRSRLDALHEVGHLILHRNVPDSVANRTDVHKLMEKQVNRFASAFLLPATSFADEFRSPTVDALLALKPRWVVSAQAMMYRAHDLGLITDDQAERFWKTRNRLWKNRREPLDDVLPVEQPFLLRRSFELVLSEGLVSKTDILAEIPLARTDIEELSGLPDRFLEETGWASNVVSLDSRRHR